MAVGRYKMGTPVHVVWVDASGDGGWNVMEDLPEDLIRVHSIGFVLKWDKQALHLADGLCLCGTNCGKVLGHSMIPNGCIKKVRRVKL